MTDPKRQNDMEMLFIRLMEDTDARLEFWNNPKGFVNAKMKDINMAPLTDWEVDNLKETDDHTFYIMLELFMDLKPDVDKDRLDKLKMALSQTICTAKKIVPWKPNPDHLYPSKAWPGEFKLIVADEPAGGPGAG